MSFEHIQGQKLAKQMIQNGLRSGRLSHAYLFHGPVGTGKMQMALSLAKAIFCERMQDDSCGACVSCRKFANENHTGLHIIKPDGNTIKLEQIKSLQHEFSFRADEDQARVYIIEDTERMTTEAANRLLKFLEEPLSHIYAILMTTNGQAVLPTIQSRAQWIPFTPMSREHMLAELIAEGHPEVLVLPAVHLATGIERARELIQNNGFAEIRNVMIQLAKASVSSFAAASIIAQERLFKSDLADKINTLLDLFVLWYKDMLHIQSGRKQQIVFIDEIDWLSQQAFSNDVQHWIHCIEQAVETQKRLRSNTNAQLMLEHFMSQV